jgi:hypothetical protein
MPDDRSLLERELQRVELRPFTLDGFHRDRRRKERNRRIANALVALLVAGVAIGGVLRAFSSGSVPATDPRNRFLGTWFSTSDADGGTQTMTVRVAVDDAVEIVVLDDVATVCLGTPSTMTGTGRIEAGTQLIIPSPVYTCDDGSEPEVLSGPPLQEQLRDWTLLLDPQTETLSDGLGGIWVRRTGREQAAPAGETSGGMWPQTSPEEVRRAQERADAGDPGYTWQVVPNLHADLASLADVEIVDRFLLEELGWESSILVGWAESSSGSERGLVYVRCAPGETNPLYPDDPDAGRCAPTIDDFRYETVEFDLGQLAIQGPYGVWVVTSWRQPGPPFRRMTPPSEAEITEVLNGFLEARLAGEGAQAFLDVPEDEVPLLYATTTGAAYERAGFERVGEPLWPNGSTEFTVRLFADRGDTVVEQRFSMDPAGRGLRLDYSSSGSLIPATTQNGEAVGDPYEILDGEVTLAAARPWYTFFDYGPETIALTFGGDPGRLAVLADPRSVETGCQPGPGPADAEALARSIRLDPDFDATEPVAVSVGGIEALRMDVVTATGASVCAYMGQPLVLRGSVRARPMGPSLDGGDRMRLYLLDLPEGSSGRILAIAISAPDSRFELVLKAAAPIVDSFEFQTR